MNLVYQRNKIDSLFDKPISAEMFWEEEKNVSEINTEQNSITKSRGTVFAGGNIEMKNC